MKKIIIIQGFLVLASYLALAQNQVDALRYSFTTPGGQHDLPVWQELSTR